MQRKEILAQARITKEQHRNLVRLAQGGGVPDIIRDFLPGTALSNLLLDLDEIESPFPAGTPGNFVRYAIFELLKAKLANDPKHPLKIQLAQVDDEIDACNLYRSYIRAKNGIPGYELKSISGEGWIVTKPDAEPDIEEIRRMNE